VWSGGVTIGRSAVTAATVSFTAVFALPERMHTNAVAIEHVLELAVGDLAPVQALAWAREHHRTLARTCLADPWRRYGEPIASRVQQIQARGVAP
jgi:hypothetical protein